MGVGVGSATAGLKRTPGKLKAERTVLNFDLPKSSARRENSQMSCNLAESS